MSKIATVTDAQFDQDVLASSIPTLVDFTAAWCGPCRVIAPALAAIAERQAGRIQVRAYDVDDNHDIATRYGVRSMPTLLMFHEGRVVGQIIGAVPPARIEALIEKAFPAPAQRSA
jgi:thioredoxin 1